jgi:hypothetical protein
MTMPKWRKAGFVSIDQARRVFIDECYSYEFEKYLDRLIEDNIADCCGVQTHSGDKK